MVVLRVAPAACQLTVRQLAGLPARPRRALMSCAACGDGAPVWAGNSGHLTANVLRCNGPEWPCAVRGLLGLSRRLVRAEQGEDAAPRHLEIDAAQHA